MEVNIYTVSIDAPGNNFGIALQAHMLAASLSRTTWKGEFAIIGNRPGFIKPTEAFPIIDLPVEVGARRKGAMARYAQWLKFLKADELPSHWFEPGKAIVFSDTDCLFLRNPTETVTEALENADVAYVVESGMDIRHAQFSKCLSQQEKQQLRKRGCHGVNSGCWAIRSEVAMAFFQHWKSIHIARGPHGDQNYFQRMIQLGDGEFSAQALPAGKYTFPMYVRPRWPVYSKAIHLHFCGLHGCTEKLKAMYGVYQSIQPHRAGDLLKEIQRIELL